MMAYETASGKQLDSTKKDLATKEVVVTGDVAQQVGGDNATNIINQAKLQIIGDNVQNADEIYNIVNNIAIQNNVSLSSDELNTITALLQEIVQQNYDIQEMKQTLESIQKNLDKTMNNDSSSDDSSSDGEEDLVDEDSSDGEDITEDVDSDVLDGAKESYTEDASVAEDTGMNGRSGTGRRRLRMMAWESRRQLKTEHRTITKKLQKLRKEQILQTPVQMNLTAVPMMVQEFRKQPVMETIRNRRFHRGYFKYRFPR